MPTTIGLGASIMMAGILLDDCSNLKISAQILTDMKCKEIIASTVILHVEAPLGATSVSTQQNLLQ